MLKSKQLKYLIAFSQFLVVFFIKNDYYLLCFYLSGLWRSHLELNNLFSITSHPYLQNNHIKPENTPVNSVWICYLGSDSPSRQSGKGQFQEPIPMIMNRSAEELQVGKQKLVHSISQRVDNPTFPIEFIEAKLQVQRRISQ